MANKVLWNDNWEFIECPLDDKFYAHPKNENFEKIDLPHDWMIYDTKDLYRNSIGWYRKEFEVREEELLSKTSIRFDGVYMDSTIYVNDKLVGEWKYGYSTFEFDITDYLQVGKNQVAVRVVYQHINTRWYSGAGIYRNVWIKTYNNEHIVSDGVYVSTKALENGDFDVEIETEVHIDKNIVADRKLRQAIYTTKGEKVAEKICEYGENQSLRQEESNWVYLQKMNVEKPQIWSIGKGNLYILRTELLHNDVVIDSEEERIGFKDMKFDSEKGFYLNGEHIKLNGVCEHHDFGCLGGAFYMDALRRKFKILRKMGVNAIRTAHNMPASELMELADEEGFLILTESFDMWEMCKTPYDYGRFFNEWYPKDIGSWVRRDRNRVSLLMWSIGNEIYDTQSSERGPEITENLVREVRKHDPKKNAPTTIGSNYMKWEKGQKCSTLVDIIGYNYGEYLYHEQHKEHPEWIIYGSETASILSSRNIYHFPLEKAILTDDDEQCSSLGNSITGWGAMSFEETIFNDRDAEFSLGQFIWTGFDYIGESTPYNTKNSYFGQIDIAGFPKDSYYVFQSEWTSYKDNPMIHIYPYWDFNIGQIIDVQVCTNAPECELFLNNKSLGRRKIDHLKDTKTVQLWKIPYEQGELCAVAYDLSGCEIARDIVKSFGETKSLEVSADRTQIQANGSDLIFLEIKALDENGNYVANAKNRVHVNVTGAGRLIGLDNGDSPDFDQYKGTSRRLFGGKLLAVIAAKTEPGEIVVTIESPEIEPVNLTYTAVKSDINANGVSALLENESRELLGVGSLMKELENGESEIPIRKLNLTLIGSDKLTKENPTTTLKCEIYPVNATYNTITWKALNESGIEIDYVDIQLEDDFVKIVANGDGDFRIRCSANNGGNATSVISELSFSAKGIGQAYLNAYKENSTGLCDIRREKALEGIEHGITFMGAGTFGFSYIDFGTMGSEEIEVFIFANTDDAVKFKVWDNDPEDGGEVILDAVYHKRHQWMVFQPMIYKLSKLMKGKQKLFFTSDDAFNFKSFVFKEKVKAFSTILASECSTVYGDEFVRSSNCIEKIGNNVLIEYDNMDFGEVGAEKLIICGSSPLEKSSIQIRFVSENGTDLQMIEFKGSETYSEQVFNLEKVFGKNKVVFVFLPGSNFNLKSIRFE